MAIFSVPSPSTSLSFSEAFRGSPTPQRRTPGRMFGVPAATPSISPTSDSSRYGLRVRTSPRGKRVRFATTAHRGIEAGDDARDDPPTTTGNGFAERRKTPGRRLRSPPLVKSLDDGALVEEEVDTVGEMDPATTSTCRGDPGVDLERPIIVDKKASPKRKFSEISEGVRPRIAASRPLQPSNRTMEAIRSLLDHPNIASFKDDRELPDDIPALHRNAGTLEALIDSRRRVRQLPTSENSGALPEPLVWRTLISLLRAVHYLHTGSRSNKEEWTDPEWQPIIHNFINPTNISYQHSADKWDGDASGSKKTPMLGIFSRCVVLPCIVDFDDEDEDEDEDEEERAARKRAFEQVLALRADTGFEAPELLGSINDDPGPASDLWSIGAVMVAMMTGRTVWDLVVEEEFIRQSNRRWMRRGSLPERWKDVDVDQRLTALMTSDSGTLTLALPECYAVNLRILVDGLLAFNPMERGTALEVLQDAERWYRVRKLEVEKGCSSKKPAESRYPTYHI